MPFALMEVMGMTMLAVISVPNLLPVYVAGDDCWLYHNIHILTVDFYSELLVWRKFRQLRDDHSPLKKVSVYFDSRVRFIIWNLYHHYKLGSYAKPSSSLLFILWIEHVNPFLGTLKSMPTSFFFFFCQYILILWHILQIHKPCQVGHNFLRWKCKRICKIVACSADNGSDYGIKLSSWFS